MQTYYLHHRKREYKQLKNTKMKSYNLIYLDRKSNELRRESIEANNLKEAKKIAQNRKANSMLKDLHKIEVTKAITAIIVCFDNKNFHHTNLLVLGTTSISRAIKAAKEFTLPDRFEYISSILLHEEDLINKDLDYSIEISK